MKQGKKSDLIRQRVLDVADFVTSHKATATVRSVAANFGVSKSTIHNDMVLRLPNINNEKYQEVRQVLDLNKDERHLRGGIATQMKYAAMKGVN